MAFNTSGIGTWTNENSQDLISKLILELESTKYFTLMPGVKYKEQVKKLSTQSPLVAAACGTPTTTGTTYLTDKDVEVKGFMTYEELCPADLETTSLQLSMKPGWNEDLPFEAQYADLKVKEIQKQIEQKLWGTTAAATNGIDGLLYLIHADVASSGGTIERSTFSLSGTSITASQYMQEVYAMVNSLPAEIQTLDDLTLFCGKEISRRMVQQFVVTGNYHIDFVADNGNTAWKFPGTNITIQPVNGLNGVNQVVLTPASNLIYATDLMNEEEKFKMWWSEDDQYVKFLVNFKFGTTFYWSDYIVISY